MTITSVERLLLMGMSILIRTQYLPGGYDSDTAKEHSAKLMDDIWRWHSEAAAFEATLTEPEQQP